MVWPQRAGEPGPRCAAYCPAAPIRPAFLAADLDAAALRLRKAHAGGPAALLRLADELDRPSEDPHGRVIPPIDTGEKNRTDR